MERVLGDRGLPEVLARRIAVDAALLVKREAWRGVHGDLLRREPVLVLSEEIFPIHVDYAYALRLPALEDMDENEEEDASTTSGALAAGGEQPLGHGPHGRPEFGLDDDGHGDRADAAERQQRRPLEPWLEGEHDLLKSPVRYGRHPPLLFVSLADGSERIFGLFVL